MLGPCWHVPPGMGRDGTAGADPVTGAVSHRQRAPAARPRRRGPGGAGDGPSYGRGAQGWAFVAPAPQGHPSATHGRSPQHAGPLLSSPAAPGTGCSGSAVLPSLTISALRRGTTGTGNPGRGCPPISRSSPRATWFPGKPQAPAQPMGENH